MLMETRYTDGDRRLLDVARALHDAAAAKLAFSMGAILFDEWDAEELGLPEDFCGSPACALGHYGVRGDLQDEFVPNAEHSTLDYKHGEGSFGQHICYSDNRMLAYFEVSRDDMELLFGGDGCGDAQTATEAAEFIENFVAQRVAVRT